MTGHLLFMKLSMPLSSFDTLRNVGTVDYIIVNCMSDGCLTGK
jgi:hypothetical protein